MNRVLVWLLVGGALLAICIGGVFAGPLTSDYLIGAWVFMPTRVSSDANLIWPQQYQANATGVLRFMRDGKLDIQGPVEDGRIAHWKLVGDTVLIDAEDARMRLKLTLRYDGLFSFRAEVFKLDGSTYGSYAGKMVRMQEK